jgi:hypothetical protein
LLRTIQPEVVVSVQQEAAANVAMPLLLSTAMWFWVVTVMELESGEDEMRMR